MPKLTLFLIALIFLIPSITFANTSKTIACDYKEGVYQESFEVSEIKKGSISEFHKKDYTNHSELWYIVRQRDMYKSGKNRQDDYSIYSYNCTTKKTHRIISQLILRKVVAKIPSNHIFSDARIIFIGENHINLNWYPEGIGCLNDSCTLNYYHTSINLEKPHGFGVAKIIPGTGPKDFDIIYTSPY